ncbi:MAG: hypothetical protein CMK59_13675 [Proteobacteria bacterium]|nr:hypothetical protein [Pseudomonadota bacterium]
MLFLHKDGIFKDSCIICNSQAHGRTVKKTLFWHTPILLPLLLLSVPFYFVLAFFFRNYIQVEIPLCTYHFRIRRLSFVLGVGLFPTAITSVIYAILSGQPLGILGGIACLISGILILAWSRNPIWATEINNHYALVRGAHPDFVQDYPEWDGVDPMASEVSSGKN